MATMIKYRVTETSIRKEWEREVIVLSGHDNPLQWAMVALDNGPHGLLVMRARYDAKRDVYTDNGHSPIFGAADLDAAKEIAVKHGYALI